MNSKWISVKDKLPQDGEDVLCIQKDSDLPLMANFNQSSFEVKKYPCPRDRVLIAYWNDITHWQPLPLPPTKEPNSISNESIETIGSLLKDSIELHELNPNVTERELKFPEGVTTQLMNDETYPNNIPVVLFRNLRH